MTWGEIILSVLVGLTIGCPLGWFTCGLIAGAKINRLLGVMHRARENMKNGHYGVADGIIARALTDEDDENVGV